MAAAASSGNSSSSNMGGVVGGGGAWVDFRVELSSVQQISSACPWWPNRCQLKVYGIMRCAYSWHHLFCRTWRIWSALAGQTLWAPSTQWCDRQSNHNF